jgi:hypothetical protein
MNWEVFGKKLSWPNFNVLSQHFPEGTENHENPQVGSLFAVQDTNTRPPEYEAGVLTTGPWRSVFLDI